MDCCDQKLGSIARVPQVGPESGIVAGEMTGASAAKEVLQEKNKKKNTGCEEGVPVTRGHRRYHGGERNRDEIE